MESTDAQYVLGKHQQMIAILDELEVQILNNWFKRAPAEVVFHLAKPMLLRNKDDLLLRLNFDPAVIFYFLTFSEAVPVYLLIVKLKKKLGQKIITWLLCFLAVIFISF